MNYVSFNYCKSQEFIRITYLQPVVESHILQLGVIDQVRDLHAGAVCCPFRTILEAALHRANAFIEVDIGSPKTILIRYQGVVVCSISV